ncbi:MAG: S8 family serine peptidase [Candidatus Bipolaricaulis sp.]|nr:S8 family serine peptidase [Candidatus Bipolaricaulis sp.]
MTSCPWSPGLFGAFSGTSFAAPYVAGVAAFQLAQNVALPPDAVEALLRAMAADIGTP